MAISHHWLSGELITSSTHPVRPDCIDIMYCMGEKVLTGFLLLGEASSSFDENKRNDTPFLQTDRTEFYKEE